MSNELERTVLRAFFEAVITAGPHDSSISDSKLVRDTRGKLRIAIQDAELFCTCSRRYYGPCEACQASDEELQRLRSFYNVIRTAKKRKVTDIEIQEFIENSRKGIISARKS